MTDEQRATFENAKARLEEILVQVKKKDTSLEQSLELLEEGVRLANTCNELIDQTSWRPVPEDADEAEGGGEAAEGAPDAPDSGDAGVDPGNAEAGAEPQEASGQPVEDVTDDDVTAADGEDGPAPARDEFPDDERS